MPRLNPSINAQQGNASLLAVILVLIMAGGIVHMTSQSLSLGVQQVVDEKHYLHAFYQAQSALHWGRVLRWSPKLGWQCSIYPNGLFSVCLYRQNPRQGILRGSSADHQWLLWQRVSFTPEIPDRAQPKPRGWSDFCPLAVELCNEFLSGV